MLVMRTQKNNGHMDVELRGEGYKSDTHLGIGVALQESNLEDAESPLAPTMDINWCFLRASCPEGIWHCSLLRKQGAEEACMLQCKSWKDRDTH